VLTDKTEDPTFINPELKPELTEAARPDKLDELPVGLALVVFELPRDGAASLITASITVEPLLTPTIFSLPGSIPRKAQMFEINVVGPLLLKKSMTGMLNLADILT